MTDRLQRDPDDLNTGDEPKHPDSPGSASVEEELNESTQRSLETLGRADLDEDPDPRVREGDDRHSRPGQNSDWTPQ
jgi:hypothetical protein